MMGLEFRQTKVCDKVQASLSDSLELRGWASFLDALK